MHQRGRGDLLQAGDGEGGVDDDHTLKTVIQVGDSGVGKSCLLDKFLDDSSTNNFISTIGVDIRSRETVINNKTVKIQVGNKIIYFKRKNVGSYLADQLLQIKPYLVS